MLVGTPPIGVQALSDLWQWIVANPYAAPSGFSIVSEGFVFPMPMSAFDLLLPSDDGLAMPITFESGEVLGGMGTLDFLVTPLSDAAVVSGPTVRAERPPEPFVPGFGFCL